MKNILITSVGRRVSLLKQFEKELKKINPAANVYAADANPGLSSACQVASKCFEVPRLNDPEYKSVLKSLCTNKNIKLVIPTIDTELKLLSENREAFFNERINLLISDIPLITECQDKRKTEVLFHELDIETPKQIDKENPTFPLFIKPYAGSSSKDIYIIKKPEELTDYHLENKELMFFEYLDYRDHTEYTVDLYYDKNSELKCLVPRKRIEVRGGEVSKGVTCKNNLLNYLSERLKMLKGARGCITLQVFVHNETEKVYGIEINPRFGGGYPLSYHAGANYPKWIIEEYFLNKEIDWFDGWEGNLLMLRYDDEVIVHDFKNP